MGIMKRLKAFSFLALTATLVEATFFKLSIDGSNPAECLHKNRKNLKLATCGDSASVFTVSDDNNLCFVTDEFETKENCLAVKKNNITQFASKQKIGNIKYENGVF